MPTSPTPTPLTLPLENYPITLLSLQLVICTAAALTTPFSYLRSAAVFCIASAIGMFHMASGAHVEDRRWNAFCGCLVVGFAMVASERLMVGRWWVCAGGPLGKRESQVGAGWRVVAAGGGRSFVTDLLLSPRGVNREWAVENIPHFRSSNPAYVPTRSAFLRRRLTSTLVSFLLYDAIANFPPPDPSMFSPSTIPFFRRFSDVTSSELALRLSSTLAFWINTYCIINVINGVLALFCVGLGLSEAKDWPPIFGAVGEAFSVRKFWGTFWHQIYRSTFEGLSRSLTENILRLRPHTLVSRYTNLALSFLISGLIHLSGDLAAGIPWWESGAMQFFLTQVVGIMLEDVAGAAWGGGLGGGGKKWRRIVGFLWVISFLTWATPVWSYPNIQRRKDAMFPVSVVGLLRG